MRHLLLAALLLLPVAAAEAPDPPALGRELLNITGTRCTGNSSGVIVSGDTAGNHGLQGLYTEISITPENDYPERDGRPVFSGQGYFLYYYSEYEAWFIGPVLGTDAVMMYATSDADHPLSIDAPWKENVNNAWVEAPSSFALSCAAADVCTPGSAFSFDPTAIWGNIKDCEGCTGCYNCPPGTASPGWGELCAPCPTHRC